MSSSEVFAFPVTFSQQQLWYLHELAPESTAYNIPLAFETHGALDLAALDKAFAALVRRHDALRTSFGVVDEHVKQIVLSHVDFVLPVIDLSDEDEAVRKSRLAELKSSCARHRFDLAKAPLLFAQVVKLGAARHVLLLCIHHIVVDHLSVLQLGRELSELYSACRAGVVPQADGDRLQYPDYAVWQRELMTEEVIAKKLDYWVEALSGKTLALDLPTDRPRPRVQTFNGRELSVSFPEDLSAALRAYAQEQKLSVFVVMLTAFTVLLQKYTGHSDIIVGCPFANRQSEELHEVVGLFMNLLPIAVSVDSAHSFTTLAHEVRRQVMRAQGLQDTPFEKIVQAVSPTRDAAQNPVVQVWFTFQEAPLTLRIEDLEVASEPLHNGGAKLDLSLWFWDGGDAIQGLIEYNTDLFDAATVQRMAAHLRQIVRQVVFDGVASVGAVDLLTAEERARMLEWNATTNEAVLPDMHGAFFRLAAAEPHRVVLETRAGERTAGELAGRADAIAASLRSRGVRRGEIVGVCLERGESLLAALLAVLRCGGAYLPLDPTLPSERIAFMLEDSGARVVIAEAGTRGVLPPSREAPLLVEEVQLDPEAPPFEAVVPEPADTAYLMYTSGSTGRPKGVLVPHRAVGNFLAAMKACPGIDRADTMLAATTYAFDISVLELFLPLTVGAKVWIADRATSEDGEALKNCLEQRAITVLQATPSTWRLLRASGWGGAPKLKALIGGEALSPELAMWLVPRVRELWNMYGPTETTIWSTCARIDELGAAVCPIGKPIFNTTAWIVDESLRELPPGVQGELVIGGLGLSSGYLNRPELTAERFTRLPATGDAIYRTGDRAMWRSDGNLQHLGRNDHQVKIRGYRIELGEIESVLSKLPEADTVVVKDWRFSDADHRLVAYYTTRSGGPLEAMTLRKQARSFMPAYMVPQHFVHLAQFPLNASGKIDRRALLPPTAVSAGGGVADDQPQSEAEKYVAELWRELIGISYVSRGANFFDSGGHSLLAIQAISRMREERGVIISPRTLVLENLAEIAAQIDSASSAAAATQKGSLLSGLFSRAGK
jgi:amino acid adenylation domain-containing protein